MQESVIKVKLLEVEGRSWARSVLCLHHCASYMLLFFIIFEWISLPKPVRVPQSVLKIFSFTLKSFVSFFHPNVTLPVHCFVTADYQFAVDCEAPCQCHIARYLFFICKLRFHNKSVRVPLSLPWRWWVACWSPFLPVVWSPTERGHSESLCTYSSSVKRQHSSC